MLQTDNYGLNIVEGTDKVNPLTQLNPNFETIDEQMKMNELASVGNSTELTTGTVHAITRGEENPVFRFTATSVWHSGDTMTVDGVQVSVLTTSGETVPEGAYVIGAEVIGILKGSVVTLYYTARKVAEATNAEQLGGQEASYYGTKAEVDNAQTLAEAAATVAQSALDVVTNKTTLDTESHAQTIYNSGTSISIAITKHCMLEIVNQVNYNASVAGTRAFVSVNGKSVGTIQVAKNNATNQSSTLCIPNLNNGDMVQINTIEQLSATNSVIINKIDYKA